MNPAVALALEDSFSKKARADRRNIPGRPNILIAAADPEICKGLTDLLEGFLVNAVWVTGVTDAKAWLGREKFTACLCGFWLQDGTYRELIRHMRHEKIDASVIIVSAPACPNEYGDYLAVMNIGVLDFLCYPYKPFDLERMLGSAIAVNSRVSEKHTNTQEFKQSDAA